MAAVWAVVAGLRGQAAVVWVHLRPAEHPVQLLAGVGQGGGEAATGREVAYRFCASACDGPRKQVPSLACPGRVSARPEATQWPKRMFGRCSRCLHSWARSRKDPEARSEVPNFQARLSAMPVRAQVTLQQALAGLAAQAPTEKADKPMLLKLAEHVAIRFALDSYERGELRVNAVKQLLDRMNAEIEGLRKILGTQEEMMANAGLQVQSYTELLDQEFWEQVPDENKKEVLTSDEAWCVPPRNVRALPGRYAAPRRTEDRERDFDEVRGVRWARKSRGAAHDGDRPFRPCGTLWQR